MARTRPPALAVTAAAFALVPAAPALAVPDCPDAQPARPVLTGQGSLESVIAGPDGALYFTSQPRKALVRLAAPGAEPEVVATGIDAPGGLLVGSDGHSIVVGYGDGIVPGAAGNLVPQAGLYSVDLRTGEKTTLATGLSMANGLAREPSGAILASTDVGTSIDRVVGSKVQRNWATVASPNGLAVDVGGRYLYANQTFQPAAVQRIDLEDPSKVERYAAPGPEAMAAGLDGLTIDDRDRLFAAANGAGELWRIDPDRAICALDRGLGQPSAVAFGGGGAFPVTDLFTVGFDGVLRQVPGARPAPRLVVTTNPRRLQHGQRTRMTVTVRVEQRAVAGAVVRVAGKRRRTGATGRARFAVRPRKRGRLTVRVRADGFEPVRRRLRVR